MRRLSIFLAVCLALAAGRAVWAVDTVSIIDENGQIKAKGGRVTNIDAQEITFQVRNTEEKIPVNTIHSIRFDDEPPLLAKAREAIAEGRYGEVSPLLQRISKSDAGRAEIAPEIAYLEALAATRMAAGAGGDVGEARQLMAAFLKTHARSYHFWEACEALGNLSAAAGAFADAEKLFARLAQAPWPDYKMRAEVATGRARLAQRKMVEAAKSFDAALAISAEGPAADAQRMAARLGKTRCMAAKKQTAEAIKTAEDIIAKADGQDVELLAEAYNVLGTAQRAAGRNQEALLAFLHVDLLYSQASEAHAEALFNLSELFRDMRKVGHAIRAEATLKDRYPGSIWTKELRGGG